MLNIVSLWGKNCYQDVNICENLMIFTWVSLDNSLSSRSKPTQSPVIYGRSVTFTNAPPLQHQTVNLCSPVILFLALRPKGGSLPAANTRIF